MATSGGLSPQWDSRTYKPGDLWPYQPVKRHPIPADVAAPGSDPNAIDAFVRDRLRREGVLQPAPPADRLTLVRRLTLDLTGLPPTPGGGRGVPERRVAGRVRAAGRPAARQPALRRADGAALARRRPLRRHRAASPTTSSGRTPGGIATTSSAASTRTSRTTASSSSSSPATSWTRDDPEMLDRRGLPAHGPVGAHRR